MRIQNNITAMNSYRNYGINNSNQAKASEKLASGYRINSAADDAAGLAISEKMRAQIRGLNTASKNAQDGISLVQTAEGALQEVHSMLQRMNELAVQSSTGTSEDFDRDASAAEFTQLKSEIDDIAKQTTFNNMKLFDGSLGSGGQMLINTSSAQTTIKVGSSINGNNAQVTSHTGVTQSAAGVYTFAANGSKLDITFTPTAGTATTSSITFADIYHASGSSTGDSFSIDLSSVGLGTIKGVLTGTEDASSILGDMAGRSIRVSANFTDSAIAYDANGIGSNFQHTGITASGDFTFSYDATANTLSVKNSDGVTLKTAAIADATVSLDLTDIGLGTMTWTAGGTPAQDTIGGQIAALGTLHVGNSSNGSAMKVQVGALEGEQLSVAIDKMDSGALGVKYLDISDQTKAGLAITATRTAINSVSEQRSALGALANRLQYRMNSLEVSSQNLSSAESRIRDVDMAKEMTNFTKQGILSQASQAMLAQANSAPQNVLQLLRG